MSELSLVLSGLALAVAFVALARSGSREPSGPRPNVLSGPAPASFGQPSPGRPSSPDQPSGEVLALIAAGRKIEAIKQYRMETGAGLKDAKETVEAFERAYQ